MMNSTNSNPKGPVSIRDCIATRSRLILFFDGDLEEADAVDPGRYFVAIPPDFSLIYGAFAPEYDPPSRVAVLRNVADDINFGDWLRVGWILEFAPDADYYADYYVRVQSELPIGLPIPPPGTSSAINAGKDAAEDEQSAQTFPDASTSDTDGIQENAPLQAARSKEIALTPALVVVIGLVALVILGVAAMILGTAGDMGTIATAAFGVVGSVVGAFFGVHAGLGESNRVGSEFRQEAMKGQMLIGMMAEDKKDGIVKMLKEFSGTPPKLD
jgi:uncharacterized membrane protein YeaQ/YmgE (transglycosylase-associated protein family)